MLVKLTSYVCTQTYYPNAGMARGPNVAFETFQFGPQSPNLPIFGLIFDGNNIKIGKNFTNLARECFSNTFFGPP